MKETFADLTVRPPEVGDAPLVLRLIQECEISEYGEPDSDLVELQEDWSQTNLAENAWLYFTAPGDLVGYAAVIPKGSRLQHDFYFSPAWGRADLGRELLRQCEARSRVITGPSDHPEWILAVCHIAHVNDRAAKILKQAGFRPVKYHFQMRMDLDGRLQRPVWPKGVEIDIVHPEQDAREIHSFIQEAFARPGRTPQPFDEWAANMLRPEIFQPELWFLAFAEDRLIGACLCFAYPEMGWVRQLGVSEAWRRKGLGTALLRHAFAEFKERGFQRVGLGVEAANPGAFAFYQVIGMECARQYDEYTRRITTWD